VAGDRAGCAGCGAEGVAAVDGNKGFINMAKKYLITVDDDNVTDMQVMKALLKLKCLVTVADVPDDGWCHCDPKPDWYTDQIMYCSVCHHPQR
jgi:hypothetical protein